MTESSELSRPGEWGGTPAESLALLVAMQHHCTCPGPAHVGTYPCSAHMLLLGSQQTLDRLLALHRKAQRRGGAARPHRAVDQTWRDIRWPDR